MGLENRSFPDFLGQRGNHLRTLVFDVVHYLIVEEAVPPRVYKVRLFLDALIFILYMMALDSLVFLLSFDTLFICRRSIRL